MFIFCGFVLKAQNEGTRFFDFTAGYEANGLFGKVAYSYFHKEDQFFRFGVQFHLENLDFNQDEEVPIQLYIGSIEYNRKLMEFENNAWVVYGGLGLLGGYELVNNGKQYTDDGKEVSYDSNFIYGGTINVELDRLLADVSNTGSNRSYLSAFIGSRLNYYQNTDIGEIQPNISAGLRLSF